MVYCLRDRLLGSASILRGTDLDAVPFLRLFIFGGPPILRVSTQLDAGILPKTCLSFCYLLMNHIVSNEVCTIRPQCLDRHSLRFADQNGIVRLVVSRTSLDHTPRTQVSDQQDRLDSCPHVSYLHRECYLLCSRFRRGFLLVLDEATQV